MVITLVTKPGCHLCDAARDVVASVVADLESGTSVAPIAIEEVSILDDPALFATYADEIPVVLIDGRVHNIWRVDPVRLRTALLEVAQ
ncbi:glutaredoxin family protein [Lacisediminihabitans changchengi]|uniref:Glutaredoxin family protein n=1 Tax=Lacisediminihabitans changchengi TaxID=2787634 RepID=A0A934SNX4_9MICO|nr:glutaredoxin family protein [Lacisediminihabitans changchengi]MBK4349003.1 glutaredoxin family protein [Lacisediminihabitans changchengi]